MKSIRYLVLLFSLLQPSLTPAQPGHSGDSTARDAAFDTIRLAQYRADPQYQYQDKTPEESLLHLLWRRIVDTLRGILGESKSIWSHTLIILLIAGALVILIFFMLHTRFQNLFTRKNAQRQQTQILDAAVGPGQLTGLIEQAIAAGDLRLALRWTYIELLKRLGDRQILVLHRDKTNADYRREMLLHPAHELFDQVADRFDDVWYGARTPEAAEYAAFRDNLQVILAQNPGI